MFDDSGAKCKALAIVTCLLGIISSVIGGFVLLIGGAVPAGLCTIVFGSVGSWLASLGLYAIGETEERSRKIAEALGISGTGSTSSQARPDTSGNAESSSSPATVQARHPIDPTWTPDGGKFVRCPGCKTSVRIDWIEELGWCPQCGHAYTPGNDADK